MRKTILPSPPPGTCVKTEYRKAGVMTRAALKRLKLSIPSKTGDHPDIHCKLSFLRKRREQRTNPPEYRPDFWWEVEEYAAFEEAHVVVSPLIGGGLGEPMIPVEEQKEMWKTPHVEVRAGGTINYYVRADEPERMERAKIDKAKRKRRQLYGGVGSERRRRAWKKRGGAQRLKGEDGKFLPATKA